MFGRKGIFGAAVGLLLIALLLATLVVAQPVRAKSTAVIERAALSGSTAFASVNGEAKWKSKAGERELEVQIQDAKKLAGKLLAVRIGGKLVGHMKVSVLGRARLVKSTQAGQGVTAPVAGKAGSGPAPVRLSRLGASRSPRPFTRTATGAALAQPAPPLLHALPGPCEQMPRQNGPAKPGRRQAVPFPTRPGAFYYPRS